MTVLLGLWDHDVSSHPDDLFKDSFSFIFLFLLPYSVLQISPAKPHNSKLSLHCKNLFTSEDGEHSARSSCQREHTVSVALSCSLWDVGLELGVQGTIRGLDNYQHHLEVYSKYSILHLFEEYRDKILVVIWIPVWS